MIRDKGTFSGPIHNNLHILPITNSNFMGVVSKLKPKIDLYSLFFDKKKTRYPVILMHYRCNVYYCFI